MSGHSKWATTHRHKAIVDAKRSAVFTKIANLITVAAREKGGDPVTNFSLRIAIDKGKAVNMPKENIERAIKRGTGEGGAVIEELVYEGVGPAKVQFIIKVLTDSRNRAASNIRHLFSKAGGSLTPVMWNFDQKSIFMISSEALAEAKVAFDDIELDLIDSGADDIKQEAEGITIYGKPSDLASIKQFLENKKISIESAEIGYVAKDKVELNEAEQEQVDKFIETLEDDEDVSDYYSNLNDQ